MIIFKHVDGNIAIMYPIKDDSDAIQKFQADYPEYVEYFKGNFKLPSREFRDAWTFKNNKVAIDEQKAKEIHLGRIRTARDIELQKLDIEQLRGKDVETKKQALRDLPSKITDLNWPNEL